MKKNRIGATRAHGNLSGIGRKFCLGMILLLALVLLNAGMAAAQTENYV